MAARPNRTIRRLFRLPVCLYRWHLGWLFGWPYRGSDADRRRLVAQLPLVAFRPAS